MTAAATLGAIVTVGAVGSPSASLTPAENRVVNVLIQDQATKLGRAHEPAEDSTAGRSIARGDIDLDGQPDLVVLFTLERGNTWTQFLAVFTSVEAKPTAIARVGVKGGRAVTLERIARGAIEIATKDYGPNDALCCPSVPHDARLTLRGRVLKETAFRATEERPPDPYVVKNLAPGGFEHYGVWTAKRRTSLYAAPGSQEKVATVEACEVVDAERGELRGRPWELRVLHARWGLHAGDRLWILARDLEEGYFELWYRGEIRDDLSNMVQLNSNGKRCGRPSKGCWLCFEKEPKQAFWVRMRTKGGAVGWTTRTEDFREGAACGDQ